MIPLLCHWSLVPSDGVQDDHGGEDGDNGDVGDRAIVDGGGDLVCVP